MFVHVATIEMYGLDSRRTQSRNVRIVMSSSGREIILSGLEGLSLAKGFHQIWQVVSFMRKIEPVSEHLPLLYCRDICDCFIVTSTQVEMDEYVNMLNGQSGHFRFF